jgi:hypothetical protein
MDPIAFPGLLRSPGSLDTDGATVSSREGARGALPTITAPEVALADSYALRLVATRRLYDSGAAVAATPALGPLVETFGLRAHPYDLDRLGASTGDVLRVVTSRGSFEAPVTASVDVTRGTVEAPAFAAGGGELDELLGTRGRPVTEIRLESK